MSKYIRFLGFVGLSLMLYSCKIYNFSGGSIGTAKTLNVSLFKNEASYRNPTLAQELSEKVKDKFLRETKLQLTNDSADININGVITAYSTAPINISGDVAAQTRLTITLRVTCINKTDKEKNFEDNISNFADFDANKTLLEVEQNLNREILDKLVQDIFNKTVNNW